jgi:hypothetical protein
LHISIFGSANLQKSAIKSEAKLRLIRVKVVHPDAGDGLHVNCVFLEIVDDT